MSTFIQVRRGKDGQGGQAFNPVHFVNVSRANGQCQDCASCLADFNAFQFPTTLVEYKLSKGDSK